MLRIDGPNPRVGNQSLTKSRTGRMLGGAHLGVAGWEGIGRVVGDGPACAAACEYVSFVCDKTTEAVSRVQLNS